VICGYDVVGMFLVAILTLGIRNSGGDALVGNLESVLCVDQTVWPLKNVNVRGSLARSHAEYSCEVERLRDKLLNYSILPT
jgi:hypothetical protein